MLYTVAICLEGKRLHFRESLKASIHVEANLEIQGFPELELQSLQKTFPLWEGATEIASAIGLSELPQVWQGHSSPTACTLSHGGVCLEHAPNLGTDKWRINWSKSILHLLKSKNETWIFPHEQQNQNLNVSSSTGAECQMKLRILHKSKSYYLIP